ncbi:hypothetical protein SNE40_016220 [Patella caerulea]|uniref:Ig-like domain-containing protein n=1 Tax=Patella caerulea TaxID=87958 RepID=A0AAN8J8W6_PATCE
MPSKQFWIIAVLILSTITLTHGQGRCETIYNSGHAIANCSNRGFDYIPWDLHHDIRTLDLSDNNISKLRPNSFDKYVNIEKLFLRGNQLKTIQPSALNNLHRLKVLDLSRNQFSSVPTKALADVPNLNSLSMSANRLNGLDKNAFQGLPFLRDLNLAGNHINVISPYAFSGLDLLETLELQDNALQSLTYEAVGEFGYRLKTIRLYNNPWFCDCHLQWLKKWLNNGTLLHGLQWNFPGLETQCAGPSLIQKKPLSHVPLEEFACPIEMYTSGSRVILKPGDSTALYCKYFSITESSVIWFKNNEQITKDFRIDKYRIVESGNSVKQSVLNIYDFQKEDEAEYRCLAENIRGTDYITFDVAFEVPKTTSPKELATSPLTSHNNKKIIIAMSTIAAFIVLIIVVCLVIRSVLRIRKRQEQKRDEIRLQLKHHELETTNKDKSHERLEGEESSNDETMTKFRPEDRDSIHSDNSFSHIYAPTQANGNTYISFSSELTEPDDISQIYSAIRNPPPPPGSHTESTTPLLDYYSPSLYESDEPIYDTRAYSVASVNVPHRTNYYIAQSYSPRTPGSVRSNNIYPDHDNNLSNNYHDDPDYSDIRDYSRPDYLDYSDYQDVYKFPCSPAPDGKNLNNKKSASVGHLGPMGPRKPPRSFHTHRPRGTTSEIGGVNYSVRPHVANSDLIVKSNYMYRPPGVANSEIMGPTYSQPMRQFGMPAGQNYGANYNKRPAMQNSDSIKNGRPQIIASNLSKAPRSVNSDTLGSSASQRSAGSSVNSLDLFQAPSSLRNKAGSVPSTPTSPQRSQNSSIGSPGSFKDLPPGTPV